MRTWKGVARGAEPNAEALCHTANHAVSLAASEIVEIEDGGTSCPVGAASHEGLTSRIP